MSDSRELAEKIESGEYFAEAREWYLQKYIYSFIERSYLVLLCLCMFYLLYMCNNYWNSIQPIYKTVPVQIRIEDPALESSRITYLGNKERDFNIDEELVKFFTSKFVQSIESYDYNENFKKLRTNLSFIKNLANEDIYNFYVDRISLRSRGSLILKYKRNLVKKINIDYKTIQVTEVKTENKVKEIFDDFSNDTKTYNIIADFEVEDITKKKTLKFNWQANLKVEFEPIEYNFDQRDYNDINYKVKFYESRKL